MTEVKVQWRMDINDNDITLKFNLVNYFCKEKKLMGLWSFNIEVHIFWLMGGPKQVFRVGDLNPKIAFTTFLIRVSPNDHPSFYRM